MFWFVMKTLTCEEQNLDMDYNSISKQGCRCLGGRHLFDSPCIGFSDKGCNIEVSPTRQLGLSAPPPSEHLSFQASIWALVSLSLFSIFVYDCMLQESKNPSLLLLGGCSGITARTLPSNKCRTTGSCYLPRRSLLGSGYGCFLPTQFLPTSKFYLPFDML